MKTKTPEKNDICAKFQLYFFTRYIKYITFFIHSILDEMAPKKQKSKKSRKQQKALKAASIKITEKRKRNLNETLEENVDEETRCCEKRVRNVDGFSENFDFSVHEQSGESAAESLNGDGCPVELAEREIEEETEKARKNREIKWIRKYLKENLDKIYELNEFGKFYPKLENIPDYDEVPKWPVNENTMERVGKRGKLPKSKPSCQYCDLVLKDEYDRYDHLLRHLQTHNVTCPCCGKKFGGLASLQQHMLSKHKKQLSKLKVSKCKKDREMYKACRKPEKCTEDQPYYLKVSKNI